MKNILSFTTILLLALLMSTPAHAIEKCKDADGKWHYGDSAVDACRDSKVTTLNERGFIESERAAPKSDTELRLEEEALAAEELEKKRLKLERDEKFRILSIYETESDIDRQRDNQLDSVQSNIDVHTAYLKGMDSRIARYEAKASEPEAGNFVKKDMAKKIAEGKKRIKSSQEELAVLKVQKEEIITRFKKEKALYIALKEDE